MPIVLFAIDQLLERAENMNQNRATETEDFFPLIKKQDKTGATELFGSSDNNRYVFPEIRRNGINKLVETHFATVTGIDLGLLLSDPALKFNECCTAHAYINLCELTTIKDTYGAQTQGHVDLVREPGTDKERIFVFYPDRASKHMRTGDILSANNADLYTHKNNKPTKVDNYLSITAISPHTGAPLLKAKQTGNRRIKNSFHKKPHLLRSLNESSTGS